MNSELVLYTSKSILAQVLLNLCSNAIKYNDKQIGELSISAFENKNTWEIHVKDNGPGISKENQAKVFDLFTTLGVPDRYNKKGTGIGLSTVQRLVQKLNGSIKIESEPENGCCFYVSIGK